MDVVGVKFSSWPKLVDVNSSNQPRVMGVNRLRGANYMAVGGQITCKMLAAKREFCTAWVRLWGANHMRDPAMGREPCARLDCGA